MKKNTEANSSVHDLQIVTLLVAKLLREDHQINLAPTSADYKIVPTQRFTDASAELHINVDLGRGVIVRIDQLWWHDGDRDVEALVSSAQEISEKVAEVRDQAPEIRRLLAGVRAAANREIAKAKRRGLSNEMISVSVMPVGTTDGDEWVIRVEHTALGQSLQLEPFAFEAVHVKDVADAFAGFVDTQISRAARRVALDEMCATGNIDSVVLAAIADAGLDVAEVLRSLRDSTEPTVDVVSHGNLRFALHWDEGTVFSQLDLGEGMTWYKNRLQLRNSPEAPGQLAKDSPLSKFFEHPFLDKRIVVQSGQGAKGGRATINCNHALLAFDAESGRTWLA